MFGRITGGSDTTSLVIGIERSMNCIGIYCHRNDAAPRRLARRRLPGRDGQKPHAIRGGGECMTDSVAVAGQGAAYQPSKKEIRMVIAASSAGTGVEWDYFFF